MTGIQTPDIAGEHLRDAAAWRLLGLLLERPRAGWRAEVDMLAAELGEEDLSAAARDACDDESTYLALLGPGGPASPREVAYRGRHDPGAILADLRGFYEAFSYRPAGEDPPDHIAIEAGFVAFMHLKAAYAASAGSEEAATVTAAAIDRFREAHLRFIAAPLAEKLLALDAVWLGAAAAALATRVGPAPAPPVAEPDPTELVCGAGGCAVENWAPRAPQEGSAGGQAGAPADHVTQTEPRPLSRQPDPGGSKCSD